MFSVPIAYQTSCCIPVDSSLTPVPMVQAVYLRCADRYTRTECNLVEGIFNKIPCQRTSYVDNSRNPPRTVEVDITCNWLFNTPGACCIGGECIPNVSYNDCVGISGAVYMGNESCDSINCDCVPQTTLCDTTITWSSRLCLSSFNLYLHGATFDTNPSTNKKEISVCVETDSYTVADKFIILGTKIAGSTYSPSLITYGTCSANDKDRWNTALDRPKHPYLGLNDVPFINSIIGVLDCVKGENTKKITITEDDVEIDNKENPWYKTIRLFVLGICDTTDPALTTDFVVKFQCDSLQCSDTPVPQPAVSSSLIVKPTNNSNDSVSMDIIDTKSNLNLLGIFPR